MGRPAIWVLRACLLSAPVAAAPVAGTVVLADGSPAPGTLVWLTTSVPAPEAEREPLRTGADGRFAGERTPAGGMLWVSAFGPGGVALWYGPPGVDLELRLTPVKPVEVLVTDETGAPLKDARATVTVFGLPAVEPGGERRQMGWSEERELPEWPQISDAAGILQLPVTVGQWIRFEVTCEGRAKLWSCLVRDGEAPSTLVLPVEGQITGRVSDARHKPLAGMRVYASGGRPDSRAETVTAADGTFRLRGLHPAVHRLRVSPPEPGQDLWPPLGIEVEAGQATDVGDLRPAQGVPIRIKVTDSATGKPVAGVSLHGNGPVERGFGPTAANGLASGSVAPGDNRVFLLPSGLPKPYVPDGDQSASFTAAAGKLLPPFAFKVIRGLMLHGGVRDKAGRPVAEQALSFSQQSSHVTARTDATGRFVAGPFSPKGRIAVRAGSFEGEFRHDIEPLSFDLPPAGQDQWLTLRELPTVAVYGTVVDAAGRPMPDIEVKLQLQQGALADGRPLHEPWLAVTDAVGGYRFEAVPSGMMRSTLELTATGPWRVSGGHLPRSRVQGQDLQASPFVVDALDGQASGRVVDAAGQPAAGAMVYATGQRPEQPLVTGADGRFQLNHLMASTRVIIALRGEREYGRALTRPGELEIRLAEQPPVNAMPQVERDLLAAEVVEKAWARPSAQPWSGAARPRLMSLMARIDPALAVEKATALDGYSRDHALATLLCSVAASEPERLPPLRALVEQIADPRRRTIAAAEVARALLPIDRAMAETVGQLALPYQPRGLNDSSVQAAMAARTLWDFARGDQAAASRRFDELLALPLKDSPMSSDYRGVAEGLGERPELVDRLVANCSSTTALIARSNSVTILARRYPRQALGWLNRWFGKGPLAAQPTTDAEGTTLSFVSPLNAAVVVAEALAPTDPAAALALAQRIASPNPRMLALAAVLPHLTAETASQAADALLQAARETGTTSYLATPAEAFAARSLSRIRPAVAEGIAKAQLAELEPGRRLSEHRTVLAFYLAWRYPNAAREAIERELARPGSSSFSQQRLPWAVSALCALNVDDAVAVAELLWDPYTELEPVVEWLLCPDELRETRPIGMWEADWDGSPF